MPDLPHCWNLNGLRSPPVEQFWMRGSLALRSEIFRSLDQAAAEVMLPDAIHRHARCQRILRAHEPSRQIEPVWPVISAYR
jgi:hypothetical protein